MKKRLIAMLLALVLALSLAACGSSTTGNAPAAQSTSQGADQQPATASTEPVEITFWHSYSEGEEKNIQRYRSDCLCLTAPRDQGQCDPYAL